MVWRKFIHQANAELRNWRDITKELTGITILWSAYLMLLVYTSEPAIARHVPEWVVGLMPGLHWMAIVLSCMSIGLASVKSMLPPMVMWFIAVVLGIASLWSDAATSPARFLLISSVVATVIHAMSFVYFGNRLHAPEKDSNAQG